MITPDSEEAFVIKDCIKSVINVGVVPKAVEVGDLPRSEKKTTRVFDYRY